jgi:peroxiredoxin
VRRTLAWIAAMGVLACGGESGYRPLAVGDRAPAYGARTLVGDSVDLSTMRERPLVLNLWATWCVPCRQEMPALQELHERFGERVVIVGVTIDTRGAAQQIRDFVDDVGVDFPILHDPDERFVRRFTTVGVPETFLIGADGTVLHRWIGQFDPLAEENVAQVEAAASQP